MLPKIKAILPKKILVVGFIRGILSKSSATILLCLTPKIINTSPIIIKNKPTSHGKIISMFKLFN